VFRTACFRADPRFWGAVKVSARLCGALGAGGLFALGTRRCSTRASGLTVYRALSHLPSLLGASVAIAVLWRQIFGRRRCQLCWRFG
jgi:multiple sugar transport system permease protein